MSRNNAVAIPAVSPSDSNTPWWLPYVAQWVGVLLIWPVAAAAHLMWGTDPAVLPWITVALTLAGGALAVIVHKITARRTSLQVHATATVAAGVVWLIAATITHPAAHPTLDAWLIGAPIIALSWNVRRLSRGGDRANSAKTESDLTKAVKAIKSTKVIEASDTKAVALIEAAEGHNADEIVRARPNLAGALGVGANRIRAVADPDNHSRATVVVVPEDQLRTPKPWPGPTSPGGSIMDPITIGIYEDGLPAEFWFPGDPSVQRNATHLLLMGMTGAGKTHLAKEIWVELLTRRDVSLVLADAAKGLQSIGRAAPYAAWADDTLDGTTAIVDQLMTVVTARTNQLAAEGLEEWAPESALDYCVIWIEEAARAVRDSDTLVDVAQTARSAGVSLVLSMQRPDMSNIPVTVRQQLGAVICCGVKNLNDATFAMGEDLIEQGADPSRWKNKMPGYAYLDAPGLADDRPTTPLRSYDRADQAMAEWLARGAQWRPEGLDAVTAKAAGQPYANRARYELDAAGHAVKLTGAGTRTATAHTNPEDTDMTSNDSETGAGGDVDQHVPRPARDPFNARISDHDDQNPLEPPQNSEPDLPPATVDSPLAEPDEDENLRLNPEKPTVAESRVALVQRLAEIRASGVTTVGPRDVGAEFFATVRSRPWVSSEMSRMAAVGDLIETNKRGIYRWPAANRAA